MPSTSNGTSTHRDGSNRSERLLEHMQRIHKHDLPNEMVALQSLLQLLSIEEAKNLTTEGQEYVRRLQNAAKRASNLVRILKEMSSLGSFEGAAQTVNLDNFARDLQGELQRVWPGKRLRFEWQWSTEALVGDARVLLHAIVELFNVLFAGPARECLVHASSRLRGEVVELIFRIQDASTTRPVSAADTPPANGSADRLEIFVAREWLVQCNAELEILHSDPTSAAFQIAVPLRAQGMSEDS